MKKLTVMSLLIFVALLYSPRAHAQKNQIFLTFQCIPGTCHDQVGPTLFGVAIVQVNATCNTGIVMDFQAKGVIGTRGPCTSPFSAIEEAVQLRDELLDDCGLLYFLDTLQMNGTILNQFGVVVFDEIFEAGCDGGEGTTSDGAVDCGDV